MSEGIKSILCCIQTDPLYALPAAIGACCLISRSYVYRYMRKIAVPLGVAILIFRSTRGRSYHRSFLGLFAEAASRCPRPVGDVLGIILGLSLVRAGSNMLSMSFKSFQKLVMDAGYNLVRNVPMVKEQMDKEKDSLESSMVRMTSFT